MFDKNEPLALPRGSVRALIALTFTGVSAFLFATGEVVAPELLVINSTYLTWYFARRQDEGDEERSVAPVYIPDDEG